MRVFPVPGLLVGQVGEQLQKVVQLNFRRGQRVQHIEAKITVRQASILTLHQDRSKRGCQLLSQSAGFFRQRHFFRGQHRKPGRNGLRRRLGRFFTLTAILAVMLTTFLTVGAAFKSIEQLAASAPESVRQEAAHQIITSGFRAALISSLIAIVITGAAARELTRPLAQLAEGAERLKAGERDLQLPVPRYRDEIQTLTLAFNDLKTSLARQEAWRRSLIADIAHDLRTPLAVMRSEIEAMQDGVQPADEAALVRLHGEVLLLARLVTDLRLLSLAESGALPLESSVLNAGETLRTLADAYAHRAADAGVTLQVHAPPNLTLYADPARLRQTLQNLLDNALRYAAPGTVELSAAQDEVFVLIKVRDHGPGFTPDALSRAFERFYRADASRTRDPQGRASSGLGLAIARALTEAQGGKLAARNHPEGGAEFTVKLPTTGESPALPFEHTNARN